MKLRLALAVSALTLLAEPATRSGIDPTSLDRSCKPCDDFWRFANGGWLDRNPIPASRASWGTMSALAEGNRERIRAILEAAATAKAAPDSNEGKIGAFYAACMDTAAIEARGAAPLKPMFDRVARISSRQDLAAAVAELSQPGLLGPIALQALPDLKDSRTTIAHLTPVGLSLPDRDYYLKDDARMKGLREEFQKHVDRMLQLLGDKPDAAAAQAATVLSFETKLAESMLTNVQRRDPNAIHNKMEAATLSALVPAMDWKGVWKANAVAEPPSLNVFEPAYMKRVQQMLAETPLEDWKSWLRWRVLDVHAPLLSKPFVGQDFQFFSTALRGIKEQDPRWQTCSNLTDARLGDPLGEIFVKKHFPPEARTRMRQLVENMRAALREQIEGADFLTSETRQNAIAKLESFVAKIGYPDKWRDYRKLRIDRGRFFESSEGARSFRRAFELAQVGKPVDRTRFGMTPPTVNAYYSPLENEIVFPAGILQPPMFDMQADDAANYGAIGAVIGHEMGHGFDDQGSKFDSRGNLRNWWTDEDRVKFEQRAACVVDQFNTLDAGGGLRHNGKLVVGEALGDLGGITLAYKAYRRSLRGKPEPPALDGFAADQRFFLAFARVWGQQYRPEATRLQLNTNPHPLAKFRANGTLQNVSEFHKAFQCKLGDAMMRPPEKQCRLW